MHVQCQANLKTLANLHLIRHAKTYIPGSLLFRFKPFSFDVAYLFRSRCAKLLYFNLLHYSTRIVPQMTIPLSFWMAGVRWVDLRLYQPVIPQSLMGPWESHKTMRSPVVLWSGYIESIRILSLVEMAQMVKKVFSLDGQGTDYRIVPTADRRAEAMLVTRISQIWYLHRPLAIPRYQHHKS